MARYWAYIELPLNDMEPLSGSARQRSADMERWNSGAGEEHCLPIGLNGGCI